MARAPPDPRRRVLSTLVLILFAANLLAGAHSTTAAVAVDDPEGTPEVTDALGREVPPGSAGPVIKTGPLGPFETADADDVRFETVDVSSDFGPETYKNDYVFNTRSADEAENQSTNWETALGHRIAFTVEIDDGQAVLECDDRFVAVALIQTTNGPLYGWTNSTVKSDPPGGPGDLCLDGVPGVRVYEMVFDLDGAPTTVTGAEFPALLSGFYSARLELYHHEPSPTDPGGTGPLAGVQEVGFALQNPGLALDRPQLHRFPERMLRMLSDTGSHSTHTNQFAMPVRPMGSGETWDLNLSFSGIATGTPFTRVDHFATRTLPGVQSPLDPGSSLDDTPGEPLLDKLEDQTEREALGVQVERVDYDNASVPDSRATTLLLSASDFPARTDLLDESYVPLHVVTIFVPASMATFTTGAESIVVPVSDREYPLRGITLEEEVPMVPTTHVLLQDSEKVTGGPAGGQAGDLFAMRGVGSGHEMITRAGLQRDPDRQWVKGDLAHLEFPELGAYRIVAMLYGPMDEFLGMRVLERGIDLETNPARYVENTVGRLMLVVSHRDEAFDGGDVPDGLDATIQVRGEDLPGGGTYRQNVTLAPGASTTLEVPLQGTSPGIYTGRFTASHGELMDRSEATIEVISIEEARAENRKWYEIPDAGAPLVVLSLLALVAVVYRRRSG